MKWLCALLVSLSSGVVITAQSAPSSIPLHVSEVGGIRRTQFPVTARIPFPRSGLRDPANVKLLSNQTEVPQQASVEARWPDGSVQWLSLDLNVTIGPNESQTYSLQYGEGVKSEAAVRGLAVTEDTDAIQIGNIRFNKSGSPLVASVKYRDDAIGTGANGLTVKDASGTVHDLSTAENVKAEIVKRGPLVVAVKYSGAIRLEKDARAPFSLIVEMPNSKSWVKFQASVDDPTRAIRDVAINLPLALGPFPWVWDFGTTRWTYGSMRAVTDSAIMSDTVPATGIGTWTVSSGPKGRELATETSGPDIATFGGWGHVQGAKEVVAYAIEGIKTRRGTYRIAIDGTGQTTFQLSPPEPQAKHDLTVYAHFVSTPVQIGAATSPAAILSPLFATCEREQYVKSGVPVPPSVR
jgi:PcRGLX-like N-terminal RIFT barrel domain